MRYIIVCSFFLVIISGCTLEVAREAGKAIKSIDATIQSNKSATLDTNKNKKIKKQNDLSTVNLIGKRQEQVFSIFGRPNLIRKDGNTILIRFDKENCIAYTYYNKENIEKRVKYFELRNKKGDLLRNEADIISCLNNFAQS